MKNLALLAALDIHLLAPAAAGKGESSTLPGHTSLYGWAVTQPLLFKENLLRGLEKQKKEKKKIKKLFGEDIFSFDI